MEYEAEYTSRSRRSFILCLITPMFFWFILSIIHSDPGVISFLGNGSPYTNLAMSHVETVNGSLYSVIKVFEKAINIFASGFSGISVLKTIKALDILMIVFPVFVLTTLLTIAFATFLTSRAVWLLAFVNIGAVLITVIPVIIAQAYYNDPRFNVPITMIYALSMVFQLIISITLAILGSFLFKAWFRPQNDY